MLKVSSSLALLELRFQDNLSARKSDRGTSETSYCYGCQTEILVKKTLATRSDIYLFLQLPD